MQQTPTTRAPVTQLLASWVEGNSGALDELMPIIYDELRRLARHYLGRERGAATLEPTALVHEAWLRLAANPPGQWENRAHFFGIAARLIRQVLVDHARGKGREKRRHQAVTLSFGMDLAAPEPMIDVLRLDEALDRLAQIHEQQAKVVELRFFAGLSIEETAEALGVSSRTVNRDWMVARAWLFRELSADSGRA